MILAAYVVYRSGLDPQFGPWPIITVIILLVFGAIGDSLWSRFRGRRARRWESGRDQ